MLTCFEATAQSIKDKQGNLADKVHEVAGKAPGDITKEDAAQLQSREVRTVIIHLSRETLTNVFRTASSAKRHAAQTASPRRCSRRPTRMLLSSNEKYGRGKITCTIALDTGWSASAS